MTVEFGPEAKATPRDARMADLLDAAEQGQACPVVNVLSGSWLIQGRPVSTREFVQRSYDSIHNSLAGSREARKFRGSAADKQEMIASKVNPLVETIHGTDELDGETLNLVDVTMVGAVGPSLHAPAVRVPVASVAAWFITDFEVKEAKGGTSTAVGFGFSF